MSFPFENWRVASDLQHPLAAPDAGYAGTDRFQDRARVERFQEGVELLGGAGELDGVGLVGDVDDAPAEDVRCALDFLAVLAGSERSTTFTTSTSLFSCLVICSTISSEPAVTMVMRDIVASSVGATVSVSML